MFLRQKGQFFVHISKSGLKALYYKALAHFLPTLLSTMPLLISLEIIKTVAIVGAIPLAVRISG
ncbi:hypothetical protein F9858_09695 [Glaesserella parasuis]|uniref:Uncharacterized protein n=1 Tax=Glaesserella parasuis TaxID=738 RepID=A0A859IH98_GLAPU|nr:hypothetical protein [Glaesserella parasuis]NNI42157.1 hypothetical protein [Pasteurella multocida]MWQ36508.1 hypothetical protein [Glaesserella parasuis]MWQ47027.1 hypothetical protein [Glaesserella parasuis]MWQ57986.1 hypothetical protein [Glaesserella parasuis]